MPLDVQLQFYSLAFWNFTAGLGIVFSGSIEKTLVVVMLLAAIQSALCGWLPSF